MEQLPNEDVHPTDEQLVEATRQGDQRAYGELWNRHSGACRALARMSAPTQDADDLVSEAFANTLAALRTGGGPTGPVRPYLYKVIRNLAITWGRSSREITVLDTEEWEDTRVVGDFSDGGLDLGLASAAFAALPQRWQEVLWMSEVEGMANRDIAQRLGVDPNAVAALGFRAREGLRREWIQAHLAGSLMTAECTWVSKRLGALVRESLPLKWVARINTHLADCEWCRDSTTEANRVASELQSA